MKTTVTLGISLHRVNDLVTLFIKQSICLFKFVTTLCEIIIINKVITCVIRWVYVNYLHFAKISLAQHFQYIKVIALNIKILRMVKIHTFLTTRTECHCSGNICQAICYTLVRPSELIAFLTLGNNIV